MQELNMDLFENRGTEVKMAGSRLLEGRRIRFQWAAVSIKGMQCKQVNVISNYMTPSDDTIHQLP